MSVNILAEIPAPKVYVVHEMNVTCEAIFSGCQNECGG